MWSGWMGQQLGSMPKSKASEIAACRLMGLRLVGLGPGKAWTEVAGCRSPESELVAELKSMAASSQRRWRPVSDPGSAPKEGIVCFVVEKLEFPDSARSFDVDLPIPIECCEAVVANRKL